MRKISLIVIHCSATRADRDFTAKDVDTAHRFRGFSCWGYHYYIRKSGQIEPMRDEDTVGAHARGFNAISLGVCYEGGLDENGKAADTQYYSKTRLIAKGVEPKEKEEITVQQVGRDKIHLGTARKKQ